MAKKKEPTEFEEFLNSLTYWLAQGEVTATVKPTKTENEVDVDLTDSEGEEFYISSYADPGMRINWVGVCTTPTGGTTDKLVIVNGVTFSTHARHIASWAVGYDI